MLIRQIAWGIGIIGISALLLVSSRGPVSAMPEPAYPDLQTVVPKHLGIQNAKQREILRFTNGIANVDGDGDLRGDLRVRPPEPPPGGTNPTPDAIQEILSAPFSEGGTLVEYYPVSTFEYHPNHHHWHIANVALFEVRFAIDEGEGGSWGEILINNQSVASSHKTGFCLEDSYKLDDISPTTERTYWECETSYQGIQLGWVDQYHQSLEGQGLDITGAPAGIYYLVSTANPEKVFMEADYDNNTAWVSFELIRRSNGNPKIEEIAHSDCGSDSPGMCGEQSTNR